MAVSPSLALPAVDQRPWYRQPWPLFVFALPAVAVIASFATLWIAIVYRDSLVDDDYYRQGLAINKSLVRDEAAARAGIAAVTVFSIGDVPAVTIRLAGNANVLAASGAPALKLVHPYDSNSDQIIALTRGVDGAWRGIASGPVAGVRWRVSLETPGWRVATVSYVEPDRPLRLAPPAIAE